MNIANFPVHIRLMVYVPVSALQYATVAEILLILSSPESEMENNSPPLDEVQLLRYEYVDSHLRIKI
jgi:hypothetical protein